MKNGGRVRWMDVLRCACDAMRALQCILRAECNLHSHLRIRAYVCICYTLMGREGCVFFFSVCFFLRRMHPESAGRPSVPACAKHI